ncbi:hypothetical protein N7495_008917 [Penicillium taxi]|uniref:uncharacterized protein n=1 Tax=Penicillium taxi TaxID=168475 RepID=UPI002544EB17|nr:uncharacterized protein N7495_008917 [Penicillium taxi]KAJ5888876.1 hypothetical protein N7495_008917 [Penicillium taxi]
MTPLLSQDPSDMILATPQSHQRIQKVKAVLQKQQNLTQDPSVALENAGKAIGLLLLDMQLVEL